MYFRNVITPYYGGMTSILKIFALYILSKWYGITFGLPFLFLFFRIYHIIINKKYNLSPLSINDQYLILKSLFFGKINTKEINLKSSTSHKKEDIIKIIKDFINNNYTFKRALVYKWNNYYWGKLNEQQIDKQIIDNQENIENKLNKKFNMLKEPPYKIFLIENKNENSLKIIFKYNSLINEKYGLLLDNYLNEMNIKEIKKNQMNKLLKVLIDFVGYPIQIILETLVIIFLSIKNI